MVVVKLQVRGLGDRPAGTGTRVGSPTIPVTMLCEVVPVAASPEPAPRPENKVRSVMFTVREAGLEVSRYGVHKDNFSAALRGTRTCPTGGGFGTGTGTGTGAGTGIGGTPGAGGRPGAGAGDGFGVEEAELIPARLLAD